MDLAVVISLPVLIVFGIIGYRDGVVKRVLEILGVFAALILTARFAAALNPWMMEQTGAPEGASLLMTWATLFFAGLLLSRLLATFVSKLVRLTILGWLDKLGGVAVGLALGILVCSMVLLVIRHIPGGESVTDKYHQSNYGRFVYYAAPNFYMTARQLGGQQVDDLWGRVLEEAGEVADDAKDKAKETMDKAAKEATKKTKKAARDATDEALEKAEEAAKNALQ